MWRTIAHIYAPKEVVLEAHAIEQAQMELRARTREFMQSISRAFPERERMESQIPTVPDSNGRKGCDSIAAND